MATTVPSFYLSANDVAPFVSGVAITAGSAFSPPSGPARPTRAVAIGAGGQLNVTMADGNAVTLTLPAGIWMLSITAVTAGATATGLVALY